MQFTPQSEDDLRNAMLLPDGIYDFEVVEAKDGQSKKGSDMITLNLKLFAPDGSTPYLRDWLVNTDHALCQMKIRHFCRSTNKMSEYEAGTLDAMVCEGATGKCKVKSQESDGYGLQNTIADYTYEKEESPDAPAPTYVAPPSVVKKLNESEDQCPF
jgi:hypothetical protein